MNGNGTHGPTPLRLQKPPTRRQLARKMLETIPVLNSHSTAVDALHARISTLEVWQQQEQELTFWQRLKRLVGR